MGDFGLDIWEQKYRSIGEDRNFLTGVTDEQNVYHESNITTTECKQFYHEFFMFICQRMAQKMSKRQSGILESFLVGDLDYKTISTSTEKTIQNTHKMYNKDLVNRMKREVFRDKEIKKYVQDHAPAGIKTRLLKWFDKETSEHYLKQCCVCNFKMTSETAYVRHFQKCEYYVSENNHRKRMSHEKHQEFAKKQKRIMHKFFRHQELNESNLNEFMLAAGKLGFVFPRLYIIELMGHPVQTFDLR